MQTVTPAQGAGGYVAADDADLVRALAAGDRAALAILYQRHGQVPLVTPVPGVTAPPRRRSIADRSAVALRV
jgi:hypothetical protein